MRCFKTLLNDYCMVAKVYQANPYKYQHILKEDKNAQIAFF